MAKKNYLVTVNNKTCKACGVCVAFCPVSVFSTDDDDRAVVVATERCTGCGQCELLCPDFCVEVTHIEETVNG